jgi:nucleoid-associated protein YgaU
MGKVEKVIVLSVLFLIAVILVVSLTMDDPLDKQNVVINGAVPEKPAPAAGSERPVTLASVPKPAAALPESQPAGVPTALLNANLVPPAAAPAPVAAALTVPQGSVLRTTAGLQDSYMEDMKFYTWKSGDTFRDVATKYFGDATKVTMLRRVNEDRFDVMPGEKILVPVFDLDADPEAKNAPAKAAAAPATTPVTTRSASTTKPASPAPTAGARVHVVKEGESLWKIAKQELGNGARWNEIFEANRDVLKSPEALHTGLELKLP